jgi:hypothetical protein
MDPASLDKLLSGTVGAVSVLSFIVVAFMRGYIVPRVFYDKLAEERDYWRSVADRALTAVEKVVPPVAGGKRP